MAPRRVLPPMPVACIVDNPDFLALPAAGAGMVFRLALHLWQTDCRPLPRADHELASIARAHKATWKDHAPSIKAILSQIVPLFEHARETRQSRRNNLIAANNAAQAIRKANQIARSNTPPDLPLHAMPISPRKAPPKPPRSPNTAQTRLTD